STLFPYTTLFRSRMGELGLLGIMVPEAWGGGGADTVSYVVALEEIARACASHAVVMSVNNSLYCDPVWKYGTDEQRARFLAPVAGGHALGCFALTEPEAGSDARNQHTVAVRDGDDYVITGRKLFISTGREASYALVFAQTVGIAAGAYERSVKYARERTSFGVPIGEHQMVGWMLADMATAIDGARLMTLKAATLKDAGRPYTKEASMAKLFAAETAMKVATDAVQVHEIGRAHV